jgi:hypothetical protein
MKKLSKKQKRIVAAVGVAAVVAGGVALKKLHVNSKGFTLVKLRKGSELCTVFTNIETLLINANIPYKFAYEPDTKQYYMVVNSIDGGIYES